MPYCADIFYRTYKRKDGEFTYPVILIHGAGSTYLGWPYQLRRIPGQYIIALDLPAHGKSGGACCRSISELVERLHEFLQEAQIYQAVFVGHSLGGAIALSFAAAYPERVRGLLLLGCGATFNIPPHLLDMLRRPARLSQAVNYFKKNAFATGFPYKHRQKIISPMHELRANILLSDLSMCNRFSAPEKLKFLQCPIEIIGGEMDTIAEPKSLRELDRLLPLSRLRLLPGAGHMLIFEKTEELAQVLSDFLVTTTAY